MFCLVFFYFLCLSSFLMCLGFLLLYRSGVFLALRGCGLNRFLPPIILSVCVRVYMWTCPCIVRSSFKMHIDTLTCILPKLTQSVFRTPSHDYKLKCEELFFFLSFGLFYTCNIFIFFFGFQHDNWTPEYFLSFQHFGTTHTAKRCSGGGIKRRPIQTQIKSRICA